MLPTTLTIHTVYPFASTGNKFKSKTPIVYAENNYWKSPRADRTKNINLNGDNFTGFLCAGENCRNYS